MLQFISTYAEDHLFANEYSSINNIYKNCRYTKCMRSSDHCSVRIYMVTVGTQSA